MINLEPIADELARISGIAVVTISLVWAVTGCLWVRIWKKHHLEKSS